MRECLVAKPNSRKPNPRFGESRWASFLVGLTKDEPKPPTANGKPNAPHRPPAESEAPTSAQLTERRVIEDPHTPFALPDHEDLPGIVISAGVDSEGIEHVYEDDPEAELIVDPNYDSRDRNWVRYRTKWGGLLRIVGAILIIWFVVTSVRNQIYSWIETEITPTTEVGDPVDFTIGSGETVNDIATSLNNAGVIGNATLFRYWLRCDGPDGGEITISGFLFCSEEASFEAGDYALFENMSFQDLDTTLNLGPIPEVFERFTIPEGLRVVELVERMLEVNPQFNETQILAALDNPSYVSNYVPQDVSRTSWQEGVLFPATYDVSENDLRDEAKFIQRMSNTFDERFGGLIDQVGRDPVISELGLSDYDLVIIASMIEEEARVAVDRPKMARVIFNRLLQDEPLGIDATVYFALDKSFTDTLTASDLRTDSPYNTRLNRGLPPTPIAAPGEAALRATLQPDPDPDLLFWVRTDHDGVFGAHTFTTNQADHNAAVLVCRELGYC